jgi:hypothetical protein
MSDGFAGKRISKEEDNKRLTPSSTIAGSVSCGKAIAEEEVNS